MTKKLDELTIGEAKKRLKDCEAEMLELNALFGKSSEVVGSTPDLLEKYVIVRTYSAGVFAGILKARNGKEVTLENARRLWYWEVASSLSELAMKGVATPSKCKFPCAVTQVVLTEVIEIISCTDVAIKSIDSVKEWKQND